MLAIEAVMYLVSLNLLLYVHKTLAEIYHNPEQISSAVQLLKLKSNLKAKCKPVVDQLKLYQKALRKSIILVLNVLYLAEYFCTFL